MSGCDVVTGGNGFIGSALVDKLVSLGRKVLVIDSNYMPTKQCPANVHYSNLDIRYSLESHYFSFIDRNDSTNGEIDTIYHLAALADIVPSIENPRDYYDTNVTGTLNVLEFARKHGCKKFVYAASASCYGDYCCFKWLDKQGNLCIAPNIEQSSIEPQYPYALTKYLGEQMVMHWHKVYGVPAVSTRIFNAYGEHQRTSNSYGAMFKVFLAQLANNKPLTIVGDGTQSRDFIHVDDVVAGLLVAAEKGKDGEEYNLASGVTTSVNRIAGLLNAKEIINIPKRPSEPDVTWADVSKMKALGWEPKIGIEQGVAQLLARVDQYKDAVVWTPDTIAGATKEWFDRLSA